MRQQTRNEPKNSMLMAGDRVVIARRFFINHQLSVEDLGECKVLGAGASFALIEIEYHPALYAYQAKNLIKVFKGVERTSIQIHPVYLEKVKVKHGKKKIGS